ncbi:hypothetical protein [Microbacterium sp. NPDC056736]|uniref:P-loop NTPase n=1 Tax=Microbacterium sp. NPDC056736 TaxID=3345932 RepID=UPI00366BBB3F
MVVDPGITPGNKWELERAGYLVVQATAEDFVESWQATFGLEGEALGRLYQSVGVNIPQLQQLTRSHVPPSPVSHDYLAGDDPLWSDAVTGLVAGFSWMHSIDAEVQRWIAGRGDRITIRVLLAARLTGITSGVLWLASSADSRNATVVWFDRSSRLDPMQVLDYCRERSPVLLIVDGGHDFARDIRELTRLASQEPEVSLYVLFAERSSNQDLVEDQLTGGVPVQVTRVSLERTRADGRALLEVLSSHGRLGALERLGDPSDRLSHFEGRDVFSAMGEVEHGAGFRARLDREIRNLYDEWQQDLVFLLALSSHAGSQVGLQEASFAVGVSVQAIQAAIEQNDHLGALVAVVNGLLRPRQRERGIAALQRATGEDFLPRLAVMLNALAPLDNRQSLRQQNRAAVLVGSLMGADMLRQIFPHADLQVFYESIRDRFGAWNARYWEQRAIYARRVEDWPRAESFAERAVTIKEDSYTYTTLGTVLIARATALSAEGDELWETYYERSYTAFEQAIGADGGHVSRLAQLQGGLKLVRTLSDRAQRGLVGEDATERVASDWRTAYTILRVGLSADDGFDLIDRAERLSREFLEYQPGASVTVGAVSIEETTAHANVPEVTAAIRRAVSEAQLPAPVRDLARQAASYYPGHRQGWGGYSSFTAALKASIDDVAIRTIDGVLHADVRRNRAPVRRRRRRS